MMGFTRIYWVMMGFTGFYWVMMGYDGFLLGCRHRRETKTKQKPKTTERMSAVVYDDPLEKEPKFHDKNNHYKKK